MSEQTGVEREPLSITIPPGSTEITKWLVSAYCAPLAMRDSREEATLLVEEAERQQYEGDVEFAWREQDATVDGSPEELYATVSGDEMTTEYTIAPITISSDAVEFFIDYSQESGPFWYVVCDDTPTCPERPLPLKHAMAEFEREARRAIEDGDGEVVELRQCTEDDLQWAGIDRSGGA